MPNFKPYIDEYYQSLTERHNTKSRLALKLSIERDGILVPITCAPDGKILDGMSRAEIWEELGHDLSTIPYIIKSFDDPLDEELFVITVNANRRQMPPFQVYEAYEKQINLLALKVSSQRAKNKWATIRGEKKPFNHEDYAEKYKRSLIVQISEMTGIGAGQVEEIRYIKRHGTEELQDKVRRGILTLNAARQMLLQKTEVYIPKPPKYRKELCPKCNGYVRGRRGCHVHKRVCCITCDWGE